MKANHHIWHQGFRHDRMIRQGSGGMGGLHQGRTRRPGLLARPVKRTNRRMPVALKQTVWVGILER